MSKKKFVDRAEEFYMDKFNTMFEHDEKEKKKRLELQKKLSANTPEEVIFENVLAEIANESEKNSDIFYKTSKKTSINEEFGNDDEEKDDEEEEEETYDDPDDEPIDDSEDIPEDEKDEMDKADEILEEIDLEEIDNPTRIELIRNIIDAAQNQTSEDEDDEMSFDDFVAELQTVIEEFQYDETDELDETDDDVEEDYSDEDMGDEEPDEDMGDEEPDEDMGDEEPKDEEPDEEEEVV